MDLFFETAPVKQKRRVHFHDFMLRDPRLHRRLAQAATPADAQGQFGQRERATIRSRPRPS